MYCTVMYYNAAQMYCKEWLSKELFLEFENYSSALQLRLIKMKAPFLEAEIFMAQTLERSHLCAVMSLLL